MRVDTGYRLFIRLCLIRTFTVGRCQPLFQSQHRDWPLQAGLALPPTKGSERVEDQAVREAALLEPGAGGQSGGQEANGACPDRYLAPSQRPLRH